MGCMRGVYFPQVTTKLLAWRWGPERRPSILAVIVVSLQRAPPAHVFKFDLWGGRAKVESKCANGLSPAPSLGHRAFLTKGGSRSPPVVDRLPCRLHMGASRLGGRCLRQQLGTGRRPGRRGRRIID